MKNEMSPTRKRYKHLYHRIRLNGGFAFAPKPYCDYDELENCALLSFDYHDSEFTGWINRNRYAKWKLRKAIHPHTNWWPF